MASEISADEARKELARRELARRRGAQTVQSGSILPISKTADGNVQFDSNAGLFGAVKRAFTLPGDVMSGKVQMNDPETGRTSDEAIGRAMEMGAMFGPVNPAVRSGDRAVAGMRGGMQKEKVKPPTADQLVKAGSEGYDAMRATGAEYPASSVKRMALELKAKLESDGFDPEVASKTHKVLDKLASPPENSTATVGGLHSARKVFGKIGQNFNDPTDQAAASQVVRGLDDYLGRGSEGVLDQAQTKAAQLLKEANANFGAGKRSDLLTGIERAGDLRAAAANSGANTGNAIRQRVASALLKPKAVSGYNADEIAALEGIVQGSRSANATRYVGNLLGGGGGLGQMLTSSIGGVGGAAVGGPAGAGAGVILPMAVGAASKGASNFLSRKALRAADEMVRMRSPLYERMAAEAPVNVVSPEKRAAIIRALLLSQSQQ